MNFRIPGAACAAFLPLALTATLACAQTSESAPAAPAMQPPPTQPMPMNGIGDFEWLRGCWQGTVNQREFREQWLPAAGGMMVGIGHTVMQGRTQDYEYLRLEARSDGVYYVTVPSGQKEAAFRLASAAREEGSNAEIYTFDNVAQEFPQRIVYRHGSEGWLYAGIEGTLNGEARKVIYPMRHVSCESGEMLHK